MKKLKAQPLLTLTLIFTAFGAMASEQLTNHLITSPGSLDSANAATFDTVLEHVDERSYPKAEMRLAQLLTDDDIEDESRANLLANLGILKAINAGAEAGIVDLNEAITLMEAAAGPYSEALVELLMAKAAISEEVEALELAEESLRRAQHITHRQDGVYTEDQLPMVRALTNVHLQQGMVLSADREQRFNLRISEQVHGEDSEELVPILQSVGAYFANRGDTLPMVPAITTKRHQSQAEAFTEHYRISLFREAIDLYDRAIEIVEDTHGANDLRLVPPLKGLANARLMQRTATRYAEQAMERALSIVESNPGTDVTDHARALVDLGDVYTITADNRAADVYLEAWNLLSDDPDLVEVRNELFGTPTRLFPQQLRVIALDRHPSSVDEGDPLFANVEFSVVDNGRVARVKVLDGNVPNEEKNMLRRHLRSAKFRPRIVDGEVVETEGLMLHQTFEVVKPEPEFSASFETGP